MMLTLIQNTTNVIVSQYSKIMDGCYLLCNACKYAYVECIDVALFIASFTEKIKFSLPDIKVINADCSLIKYGSELRSYLDMTAQFSGNLMPRVLVIFGIEDIPENELEIGLNNFGSYLNAFQEAKESPQDISYKCYDYSCNPEGLSVLVVVQKDSMNHWLKYRRNDLGWPLFKEDIL